MCPATTPAASATTASPGDSVSGARTISIRGARTHNLKDLDVDIPRDRLVVVAGLSGSGKSSLVFETIAAEAGFQLNETFPPFARNRLPRWSQPDVDSIHGVSPVIVIDQRRLGGNARSTVGTVTDAWSSLRLLFSRLSTPHIGDSGRFSFNLPDGMCPTCSGLGVVVTSAVERFLDLDRSLAQGAIRLPGFSNGGYWYRQYADIGSFDATTPLREWTEEERHALLYGGDAAARLGTRPPKDYEGVVERFERIHLHTSDELSERKAAALRQFTRAEPCPDCHGDRLAEGPRSARLRGFTIGEMARMEISGLVEVVAGIDEPGVAPVRDALVARLGAIRDIGLGYLQLARATTTLSGGESQRIKTVKHLGSSLVEMLYVFDEPTIGLHPSDVDAMIRLLEDLRDKGNTVIVVEHDPRVLAAADHVLEIGPGAGEDGGRLVLQGTWDQVRSADTATGRALRSRTTVERNARTPRGTIPVRGARRNNLQEVDVDIPIGVLTVLTGVAGSGKSSLAAELVTQHEAIVVDQRPVAATRRSTPLTYAGIAAPVRALFAREHGTRPGLFSANSEGGCPTCDGLGIIRTDLAFMDGQQTPCETCDGTGFRPDVLAMTLDGLSIADVEALTISEAVEHLPSPKIRESLADLEAVGLGYLRLGQALSTLSGGEIQRVKIAGELHSTAPGSLYVLDEPTTGLHPADIGTLMGVLDRMLDAGRTVVVIEHELDVIRRADHLIDLGPGPGRHGGRILYEGPVTGITGTPTARALG
ncbi:excinuclease ABC subunit UvrA [Brachybacterium halotolerans subsp. kimchii]|uniref:ATP-binding cassette domain-containing protein n=1 Tax=Brachybacterium halotolerans TaxID=2795215 RepID=UPI001E47C251|nr:excinuclease ABC subunit UvrA [Brachybacterium halotolerans]UEJ81394.1 excinuclease ABC subunit UvrA [Brachybacterium halotolerans subsp. kimchii]